MSFFLLPDHKFKEVADITPEFLKSRDIGLLLLDLDNTVSPYKVEAPTKEILDWTENMKKAGISLYIVSNNKGDRPKVFAAAMGIPFIKRAKKPSSEGVLRAMAAAGFDEKNTALVGDQVYTDMIAANSAGVMGILVEPVKFTNPFLAIRYFAELPFRHEKNKRKGSKDK